MKVTKWHFKDPIPLYLILAYQTSLFTELSFSIGNSLRNSTDKNPTIPKGLFILYLVFENCFLFYQSLIRKNTTLFSIRKYPIILKALVRDFIMVMKSLLFLIYLKGNIFVS